MQWCDVEVTHVISVLLNSVHAFPFLCDRRLVISLMWAQHEECTTFPLPTPTS